MTLQEALKDKKYNMNLAYTMYLFPALNNKEYGQLLAVSSQKVARDKAYIIEHGRLNWKELLPIPHKLNDLLCKQDIIRLYYVYNQLRDRKATIQFIERDNHRKVLYAQETFDLLDKLGYGQEKLVNEKMSKEDIGRWIIKEFDFEGFEELNGKKD